MDLLVVGAGTADLTVALFIPEHLSLGILTRDQTGGSTRWAQDTGHWFRMFLIMRKSDLAN
ncbi:MAG TPA: hypothetical protein DCQ47_04155 [Gammaproteobacteria bacterium]|nr:hypothetical protein [Gammaproteobacteria bacterium]